MAKMVNAQVKEKLAAALAEYGDLEELKRKAAEADQNQSKIDKILEKQEAAEKRAEAAELQNMRHAVAQKLGLSDRQVARLKGKTLDELIADGESYIEENGIK